MEWHPDKFEHKIPYLKQRSDILSRMRDYFTGQGYLEVETPHLQTAPGMEVHVHAFQTELLSADQQTKRQMYLHTSPEFAMKKLLVAGLPKIFQICKCFRNAEGSPQHSPEFSMLEFYHAGADYMDFMDEVEGLIRHTMPRDKNVIEWRGLTADPYQKWQRISVCEAFEKYADIDLSATFDDLSALEVLAGRAGIPPRDGDTWDDLFFRIFLEKIEPQLGHPVPTILYDYPACMSALARLKPDNPELSERFEVYVCGLELGNAFGELTNATEQRQRFEQAMQEKQALYGHQWPVEDDFIRALEYGLPPCSGIAIGVDRLVMLMTGADRIDLVQALSV